MQKSENFHSIDQQKHLSSQDKPGKRQRRVKVLDRESCIGMQNCMLSWSAICKFFHFSINVHFSSHRWDANQSSHQNNPSPVPELHPNPRIGSQMILFGIAAIWSCHLLTSLTCLSLHSIPAEKWDMTFV